MDPELSPAQIVSYSAIIDGILAVSDLTTISAKAIRKGLQDKLQDDLQPYKSKITILIMERFDRFSSKQNEAAQLPEPKSIPRATAVQPPKSTGKRKSAEDKDDSLSEAPSPPKKVKKAPRQETDEQIAKRMQAEYNASNGRSTRGGGVTKRKTIVKKEKTKKKSAAKVRSADDSDVDSDSSVKSEKEKKGGFHKPLGLSPALQDLLGASQLSRPQTVKQIWAYVKLHELQQPDDKRWILCDDKLRAIFKCDKVHMFTMNKILATQLYPVDE